MKRFLFFLGIMVLMMSFLGSAACIEIVPITESPTVEPPAVKPNREIEQSLIVPTPDRKYDFYLGSDLISNREQFFGDLLQAVGFISVRILLEQPDDEPLSVTLHHFGQGIIVEGHVLTVSHLADESAILKKLLTMDVPFDTSGKLIGVEYYFTLPKLPGLYHFLRLKKIFLDRKTEIAWFSFDTESPPRLPEIKLGLREDLEQDNILYVLARDGIKTAYFDLSAEGIAARIALPNNQDGLVFGDSGSPVFALRDGAPELVGLVVGMHPDNSHVGWIAIQIEALIN